MEKSKQLTQWKKVALDPLVADLATMARHAPQYAWHYLYKLERQKLICMDAYISHSRITDEDGNYSGKRWIELGYIIDIVSTVPEQLWQLNTKNDIDLLATASRLLLLGIDEWDDEEFEDDDDHDYWDDEVEDDDYTPRSLCLRKWYQRKAEPLYHRIRLEHTRMWRE